MTTKKVYIEPTIIVAALIQQGHLLIESIKSNSNIEYDKDGFTDDELDR